MKWLFIFRNFRKKIIYANEAFNSEDNLLKVSCIHFTFLWHAVVTQAESTKQKTGGVSGRCFHMKYDNPMSYQSPRNISPHSVYAYQ